MRMVRRFVLLALVLIGVVVAACSVDPPPRSHDGLDCDAVAHGDRGSNRDGLPGP